jgi:hypothetical protein
MLAMQQNIELMMQRMQALKSCPHLCGKESYRLPRPHLDYDDEYDDQDVIDRPAVHRSRRRRFYLIYYITFFYQYFYYMLFIQFSLMLLTLLCLDTLFF